ncbi:MAG: SMC-Scp complex subunit ScpB [Acidimicrobiales bacterium]
MTENPSETLAMPIDDSELDPEIDRAIEAVVMVAEQPVPTSLLAQLCEIGEELVDAHCERLARRYNDDQRGFVLVRVAGGYRYQSHVDQAAFVERYVLDGQSSRLSAAALETLAIVAYKQPISRAQVAAIRGVNVDAVMRTLDQRGYIAEIARDPGPGQAVLFGTTQLFLEKVGIDSLDDLPTLGDFVPGPEVVEALEAGLRVDVEDLLSDADTGTDAEADADGEPPADQAAADEVVDLTTGQPAEASAELDTRHPGQAEAVVIEMPGRSGRSD